MGDGKWFRRGGKRKKGSRRAGGMSKQHRASAAASLYSKLSFESLEDRRLLATFLVANLSDVDQDGNAIFGSLRWALNQTNAEEDSDTIVFADGLFTTGPAAIGLNGGQLTITQPLRILGPGPALLTIAQTRGNQRIFELNIGDEEEIFPVQISGVTLSGGNLSGNGEDKRGGAIFNRESLTMVETIVTNNSAGGGGGGVYTARGRLTVDRSLFTFNAGAAGGAIMNGTDGDETRPTATITNSTFTSNTAFGGGMAPYDDPMGGAWGGAIFNANGRLTVTSCTITGNSAAAGAGVASFGNPVPDDPMNPPPAPTVFTFLSHSIIWGNGMSDVDRVGETDDDPVMQLLPSIFGPEMPGMPPAPGTLGHNIIGTGNITVPMIMDPATMMMIANPDYTDPMMFMDMHGVDPMFVVDPFSGAPLLDDFGGSTPIFLLDQGSPALDAGDPMFFGSQFEQRGRHFTRVAPNPYTPGAMPVVDIGAAEMQEGVFVVDSLFDITDGRFSLVYRLEFMFGFPFFTIPFLPYEAEGNFAIREAIEFASKNPFPDVIRFSPNLNTIDLLDREDLNDTAAPTIVLVLGSLPIDANLVIEGPESYILEIDAVGNDPNPSQQNGGGSRVFVIDDFDPTNQSVVSISNLTIMGADFVGRGGGIFSREDLTLTGMTFKRNNATDDGGGLFLQGGTVLIDRSTFNNNRAGDDGGGLFAAGGAIVTITNSTFSSNTAGDRGAGILNENSQVLVEYSTLTLNSSGSTFGSGINNFGAMALTEVRSSIISGNANNDVTFLASTGATAATFASLGYNFIGRGNALTSFTNNDITFTTHGTLATNPMLEPLFNTGGLVETHRPIYRPAEGLISPVIDAGDPMAVAGMGGVPDLDQRNVPFFTRVFDVPGVGSSAGARIDIGSYEIQGAIFLVDSALDDNDGDISTFNFTLREAIGLANQNPLPDIIQFDLISIGSTIFLGLGILTSGTPADIRIATPMTIELPPGETLVIDGSALDNPSLTIDGSRMFTVDDGVAANHIDVNVLGGFEFRNAFAPQAGGVFWSSENLTFDNVTFIDNKTIDVDETEFGGLPVDLVGLHGGAIYQQGAAGLAVRPTLTITNSLFTGNSTDDVGADGGAVYVLNAILATSGNTFAGNATRQPNSRGGAIAVKNSTFTSEADSITGNSGAAAGTQGGGFFSDNSIVTLNETVVSGNATNGSNSHGGGFSALNSNVTLNDAVVSLNNTSGNLSAGGGIFVRLDTVVFPPAQSSLTLNRSLVTENIVSGPAAIGGGIAMSGGSVLLDATAVTENQATGSGGHGGGIANVDGTLVVRGSTIADNRALHATAKGGGVYSDTNLSTQSTLILNSTISGNDAKLRGGGVFNADGRVDIKHSTITNNDVQLVVESLPADFDNDIDVDGNDFLIWQRNVGRINAQKSQGDANNDAVVNGGDLAVWRNSIGAPTSVPNAGSGVASQGNGATRTTVQSSIIAGNRGPGGVGTDIDSVDPSTFNSFQSLGYNLIGVGNATAAFNQTGDVKNVTDPVLGPLAFNGLPAGVMFDLFTHAVLPGSPAINAGSPAFNPNSFTPPLTLDQRGAARVQAGRIDIGAYESAFFPAVVASESFASPSSAAALVAEEPESGPYQPSVAASGASSLALLGDVSAMFDGDNPISSDSTEAALAREATLRDGALTVLSSRTFRPELRSRISVDELEPLVSAGDERDAAGDAEDEVFAAWGEDLLI